MAIEAVMPARTLPGRGFSNRQVGVGLIALALAIVLYKDTLPGAVLRPPDWLVAPLAHWLNVAFTFMQDDLGLTRVTRAVAAAVAWLLDVTSNLLTGSRGGFGFAALPWTVLAVTGFAIGYTLKGWRLAMLTGGVFVYLALFGQWKWAMETLSLVFVAAPLSVALGFSLGVAAYRRPRFEAVLMPVLNICQSLPHFSYLIPVVVFFGVGDHAGAIATVIFATPPMIRMTILGLKKVPPEVVESGQMCGANRWQLLRHVRAPTAREEILVGVNQVIMQCLAMVVIASFIGAPGLGYRLLLLLQSLKIGKALEIGVSIVLIAVALDRASKAWAERQPVHHEPGLAWWRRHRALLIWAGLVALAFGVAQLHEWAHLVPRRQALSTAQFWDTLVDWITLRLFDPMLSLRTFLSLNVLVPMRDAYLAAPWVGVVVLAAAAGWLAGGRRCASIVAAYFVFIAISGWWERAMITAYMVSFAVGLSVAVGLPLGIWAAGGERRSRAALTLCDTFQTFPSFIYLIPVIMLFQVNDVSAIAAVVIYGTVPVVRYTVEGLRGVPLGLREAVAMAGANRGQTLRSLSLPMALPHIMVGLNQAVMFSLFMVIIAAFIGTQDLGQEMMRALSANDVGKGLVLGLCVASMGLAVDVIANTWSAERKRNLGLA
ncbi:MAG: ABC transporter permease [Gammaproteobacteria bacterium]